MTEFGLTEKDREIINNIFKKNQLITKVVVYGSRAMGNYKLGSDIDMTLYSEKDISFEVLSRIMGEFDDSDLPYLVDISLYSKLTNVNLIEHINRVGKIIYEQ